MAPEDEEKSAESVVASSRALPPVADAETAPATAYSSSTQNEKRHDDEASAESDADPYGVAETEQPHGDLSHAERGEADETHHHHHHGRVSDTLSRVASNASATVRRYRQAHSEPLEHIALSPVPLMDLDKGIVGWDAPDDPALPFNFTPRRKWMNVTLLAMITLMTPFASSILAPGINFMDDDFHSDSVTIGSLAVCIYLLGYAVGPLFLSGMSEMYGRYIVLTGSNIFFCVWQIACALAPSLDALIVFRVLAGIGGSACMSLGGASIGDLFVVEERGLALSAWTVGPLIGPSIGPIAGAWIAQQIGWRWDFWVVLIGGAVCTILLAVFTSETSHHVLIKHKVVRLSKELGRDDLRSCYQDPNKRPPSTRHALLHGLIRPLVILVKSPVLLLLSIYTAFAYGVLYLLFNTIPMVFQEGYHWDIGITGLVYIPLGVGYIVGLFVFAKLSDRTIMRLTKKNNGVYEPEMRLVDCIYFACCLPITFFWYGWAADKKVHWIVPTLGLFPYGFAVMGIWQPAQAFVIDAFDHYAASATAAFIVLRAIVGAFLPLAGPSMYETLGVGWGNSLLGLVCIVLIPVPLIIYRYGGYLRRKYPLTLSD